jgi:hypothetical protein
MRVLARTPFAGHSASPERHGVSVQIDASEEIIMIGRLAPIGCAAAREWTRSRQRRAVTL